MTEIFICYRRDDSAAYAGRLYDQLAEYFGHDHVFMDIDHIEPGEDFVEVIQKKLTSAQVAIILIGKHWLNITDATGQERLDNPDDFVRLEIGTILERKIHAIPVLVGDAVMPKSSQLPEVLASLVRRNAYEISDTRFHDDVNKLIHALEKVLPDLTPINFTKPTHAHGPDDTQTLKDQLSKKKPRKVKIIIGVLIIILIGGLTLTDQISLKKIMGSLLLNEQKTREKTDVASSELAKTDKITELTEDSTISELMEAAEQGDAEAQNILGLMYASGRGVAKNEAKAVEWYRKAAEQGNATAQNSLGVMYEEGRGVVQDDTIAMEWYRKAAEQGDAWAQTYIGLMYEKGKGVTPDEVKAVEWYRKAAEQGYATAQYNLGLMYENGRGVTKDEIKAVEWYLKAAIQGHNEARNALQK
ncbi:MULTISPECIES: toll/interleukin-1 receptor domain-containing protein [Nitrosomonas]|uniref:Sel1 repeat-containing protein n=1 Tax=Nitrosomonas communis TaxID=44574 RepID=A0A5D3YMH9_9PROT|nr:MULTISPECIES: toll/interleukin-1 receptor domain-containing protein [Nitrosomonas]TYP94265.1 Sel1 repeat-containing protein [Nitrosomonas communis]UVS60846.1 toll/interleukin-1 receptor domain-containing protein [Nitrosomonas sp. PLL12]